MGTLLVASARLGSVMGALLLLAVGAGPRHGRLAAVLVASWAPCSYSLVRANLVMGALLLLRVRRATMIGRSLTCEVFDTCGGLPCTGVRITG